MYVTNIINLLNTYVLLQKLKFQNYKRIKMACIFLAWVLAKVSNNEL